MAGDAGFNRSLALEAAYLSAKDRLEVTKEEFLSFAESWDVHPVELRGEVVGALLIREEHIHACVKPEAFGRWLNKRLLNTLFEVIEKHGRALTTVKSGNEIGEAFVKRLGFRQIKEESGVTVWELRLRSLAAKR